MMIYKHFFLMWLWFLPLSIYADIGVSPMIVDLMGKDADAEISVKNFDTKHNAYVEITPYRLVNPANHAAPKKRVHHPEKDGLLVFPAKLVLLPGQTQFVRIVKTAKALASDQVYEVDFIPKVSTHLVSKNSPDGANLGIRVIVGYGARVILRPDVPAPSLSVNRIKNELIIKNTGNTAVNITSCSQQISSKKAEVSLPGYTLFAGQAIRKELAQPNNRVTLDAAFMGKLLGPFYSD
jgi:Mat/Ecp fimbriae periplasmic chaperone